MRRSLTDRDVAILYSLYGAGFMSFSQIEKHYFPGRTKGTVHNRLTLLEQRGLVLRTRVGRLFHHYENREIGVVFQPTKKAIRLLQLLMPQEKLKEEPVAIAMGEMFHDLMLSEVIECLAMRFGGAAFRNSKTLPRDFLPKGRMPDAVTLSAFGKWPLAVELEISGKSEARYRQIITSYRVNPEIEKVLYITGAKVIEEKLMGVIAHKPRPGLPMPMTGKFYFADLKELLNDPMKATIGNGKEWLSLSTETKNEYVRKDIA